MPEWKPLEVGRSPSGAVRLVAGAATSPVLVIPADICTAAIGSHPRVKALSDGSARVALKGSPPAPRTLKISNWGPSRNVAGGAARISAQGALASIRKTAATGTTIIPHEIADGMLILDLSGLPDANGSL